MQRQTDRQRNIKRERETETERERQTDRQRNLKRGRETERVCVCWIVSVLFC